jgi:hypothetical protein
MPTNLALDDQLIEEARLAGSHKSKKEAVNAALEEYVRKRRQLRIIEAFGTFPADANSVDPAYDSKSERKRTTGRSPSKRLRRHP